MTSPAGWEHHECPYCGSVYTRPQYLQLHLGQAHTGALDSDERAAADAAAEAERAALRLFRLKALAVLVAVYFGFLLLYAFAL
jgi:hypothetical protein